MLDAHPDVRCYAESGLETLHRELSSGFQRYNEELSRRNKLRGRPLPVGQTEADRTLRQAIGTRLLSGVDTRISFVGDKDPRNARIINQLVRWFPAAAVVHIIRDPRDVAVSMSYLWQHHAGPRNHAFAQGFSATGALSAASDWRDYINRVRGGTGQASYHEVRYEELLTDPDKTLGAVLEFLGARSEPGLIETIVATHQFAQMSGGRARGEEEKTAFFRKGVEGDWRSHFSPELELEFRTRAGALLDELGYM